jgi:hypothetical protein
VGATGQRPVDGAAAVLVEGAGGAGVLRHQEDLVLAGLQQPRGEPAHLLVQDGVIAGTADVERRDVGQPEQVVGEAGADALAQRRVPPVQHVALHELVGRVQQDLPARERGIEVEKRRRVLQLVTEAERAARLVVRRPRPHPARQVLVREPAVHHDVDGR